MATFDTQKTTWIASDVQHFARRAGFGVSPEAATALAGQALSAVVDAWVDATADPRAFLAALPIAPNTLSTFHPDSCPYLASSFQIENCCLDP